MRLLLYSKYKVIALKTIGRGFHIVIHKHEYKTSDKFNIRQVFGRGIIDNSLCEVHNGSSHGRPLCVLT